MNDLIKKVTQVSALFLEEDLNLRSLISHALSLEGIDVTGVSTLQEFEFATEKKDYEFFILKSNLLGQKRTEILKKIRCRLLQAPIILIGASSSAEDRIAAYQAGADHLLDTPIQVELLSAVASASIRRMSSC